jgi:hypothetical protein
LSGRQQRLQQRQHQRRRHAQQQQQQQQVLLLVLWRGPARLLRPQVLPQLLPAPHQQHAHLLRSRLQQLLQLTALLLPLAQRLLLLLLRVAVCLALQLPPWRVLPRPRLWSQVLWVQAARQHPSQQWLSRRLPSLVPSPLLWCTTSHLVA